MSLRLVAVFKPLSNYSGGGPTIPVDLREPRCSRTLEQRTKKKLDTAPDFCFETCILGHNEPHVKTQLCFFSRALVPCCLLLSNKILAGSRRAIGKVLDQLGIRQLFKAIVTNEDVEHQKPAPDIYLEAARRIGVPPQFCRAYEDTNLGLEGIRAAGMEAIDVRTLLPASFANSKTI